MDTVKVLQEIELKLLKTQSEMILIPGGTFLMGSPKQVTYQYLRVKCEQHQHEHPQHEVTLAPFLMGRYPVTQAQWRAVASLPLVERELDPAPSHFKGDYRPVEQVSWFDAMEFCARLSAHTGKLYTLPSEAQWEYACRADTTTPFHFGETIDTEIVNYNDHFHYDALSKGGFRHKTTDVGSFPPNAFGLYDMHGNVSEWCLDHWHGRYIGAPTDGNAWVTEGADNLRVRRGGSWLSNPRNCRCAFRNFFIPDGRDFIIGFRVVSVL
jgi:formylglycine-generating enzyme required for sulfatase activity